MEEREVLVAASLLRSVIRSIGIQHQGGVQTLVVVNEGNNIVALNRSWETIQGWCKHIMVLEAVQAVMLLNPNQAEF